MTSSERRSLMAERGNSVVRLLGESAPYASARPNRRSALARNSANLAGGGTSSLLCMAIVGGATRRWLTSALRHWVISRMLREEPWLVAILLVVVLRLHNGVKLEVLSGHGIRIRQVGLHEFVVPGFLLGLALPDFTDGESAGNRIRDVHDKAGLLLQKWVKSRGYLVVGRLIHSGGGKSHKHGHWVSLCSWCVGGGYTCCPVNPNDGMGRRFCQCRSKSEPPVCLAATGLLLHRGGQSFKSPMQGCISVTSGLRQQPS